MRLLFTRYSRLLLIVPRHWLCFGGASTGDKLPTTKTNTKMKNYYYYLTDKLIVRQGSLADKIKGSRLENIDSLPSGVRALGNLSARTLQDARSLAKIKISNR